MNGSWFPAVNVDTLRREMDRLFQDFIGEPYAPLSALGVRRGLFPALNAWAEEEDFFVEAELPGLKLDDLDLSITGNELTIQGKRRAVTDEKAVYHRRERGSEEFTRKLRLPCEINAEQVSASLKDGILTVKLPKAESAKPRRIVLSVN